MSGKSGNSTQADWTQPAAMAIPKEGFFKAEKGRYGPVFPKTPACYGFTIIAKIIPGREAPSASTGRIEETIAGRPMPSPCSSSTTCGGCSSTSGATRTSCTRASSTPTSTSTPRTRSPSSRSTGINTVFENLEGFPDDWKTNPRRSSSSSATISARASWSTASIPYVTRGRDQEGAAVKDGLSDDARPDAVGASGCSISTTSSTSC